MGKLTETCAYLHLMGKLTNVRLKLQLWSIGHHCREEKCFAGKVAMVVELLKMLAFWLYGFFSTCIDAHITCESSRCKAENDQPTTLPFNPLFSRLHRYTGWCDVYHVKCTRVHQEMITPFHFIGHDGGDGDVDGGNGDNTSTLSTLQGALPDGGQWVRTFRVTSLPTSDPGHLLRFYLNVILEMRFHRLYCL